MRRNVYWERLLRCKLCKEDYVALDDAGICEKCYKEANEAEEKHKSEIDYLKAKVSFLGFQSLIDSPLQGPCPYLTCFSDFNLVTSSDDSSGPAIPIPAHKAVLVSRSPVFRAMLENEMEESLSGTIKINDASHEALFAFVNFLYTAEACLDEDMACELLVLAEKYQVQHLKTFCENFLIPRLDWDNSITSYAFAQQHNAKRLIEAALSVITNNMNKLTEREEYLELKAKDPRLVVEIYEAYLSKQIKGAIQTDFPP
ncbi:hypothetical protein TIFTF001_024410 [Ficus carica]|uniref:BTB domain-containing protein n=1 Tax=Ficus carica TaxID=3494 RepID=A0AA88AMH2_FICCA|nr:hypothetical protein TIFTF001_024410 [Ficus carica]